ncbi:MAG: AraC family transcriptional regulator [Opitutaceae bacterium]
MPAWSPILVQKVEIQALNLSIRKLQLNRHRQAEVGLHHHETPQIILYLSGSGRQRIASRSHPVRSGDLFLIPGGINHGFTTEGSSQPLSLVLDYERTDRRLIRARHRRLGPRIINELHAHLSRIPPKGRLGLSDYATVISVVARLFELSRRPRPESTGNPSVSERTENLLRRPEADSLPLRQIAREAGFAPDYLNRRLKAETGRGLRKTRDAIRLERANQSLQTDRSVAEAAHRAGFTDPAYFSRWYRKQTGMTPSAFRRETHWKTGGR